MRRMRVQEVIRERFTPGQAILLFITDRCPVGCAHCSVDSRRDSPKISDFALFERLVDGICADPDRHLVGISGGEPFVERRGLTLAMKRLAAAGKDIVLYTSGVWARAEQQPQWIVDLLPLASCVFLSTDAFHTTTVGEEQFVAAARTVAAAGVPVIVQVLNVPDQVERATDALVRAFGNGWAEFADLSYIEPLPYGRGAGVFARPPAQAGASIGSCTLLTAPVVRYDGRVSACCNEPVIMGRGPDRLRRSVVDAAELAQALNEMSEDSLLTAIATAGAGAVTALPDYAHLADEQVNGVCDLCWRLQESTPQRLGAGNPMLSLLPLVARGTERRR